MVSQKLIPAAAYARRSTDLQERSIPDQRAAIERWATENGYRVVRWFVDDAVSGTSARGRDQFQQLLHAAENGRDFDAVLCYDMSRFSRGGTNETGFFLHRLRMAGVETVFTAEAIPEGDEGELLQGVKSWQARQYSVKLSRDSIRGQHSTVTIKHSAMGGRAPYGYDRRYLTTSGQTLKTVRTLPDGRRQEFGPDGKHLRFVDAKEKLAKKAKSDLVKLVPGDPAHIAVVREVFQLCAKGYGFRSIVIALNQRGVPGPMESTWNQQAIKTILNNPAYRGALAWNRRTFGKIHEVAADGSPVRKKVPSSTRNPKSRWIVIEDIHEPLVSADLYRKAHAEMAKRRSAGGSARPTQRYLLSGLVRCTHCGKNFWGCVLKGSKREIRYYTDASYRAQGPAACKATHIQAEPLDAWVVSQLQAVVGCDPELIEQAVEQFVESAAASAPAPAPRRDHKKEIAEVNARIKSVVGLLSDTDLADVEELRRALVDLKKRREALLTAEPAATAADTKTVDTDALRAWARERVAGLADALKPGSSTLEMRKVVHEFVDRIEIDPERRVGTLYLPGDMFAALQRSSLRRERHESSSHS